MPISHCHFTIQLSLSDSQFGQKKAELPDVHSLWAHFLHPWHSTHTSRDRLLLNGSPQMRHGHSSSSSSLLSFLDLLLAHLFFSFIAFSFFASALLHLTVFSFLIFLFSKSCILYGDDFNTVAHSALLFLGRGRLNFGGGEKDLIASSIAEIPGSGIVAVGPGVAAAAAGTAAARSAAAGAVAAGTAAAVVAAAGTAAAGAVAAGTAAAEIAAAAAGAVAAGTAAAVVAAAGTAVAGTAAAGTAAAGTATAGTAAAGTAAAAAGSGSSVTSAPKMSASPNTSASKGHSPHTRKPETTLSWVEHLAKAFPNSSAI